MLEKIKSFLSNPADADECFQAGFDCGMNGANTTNCAIKYFSSKDKTKKWEEGKKAGDEAKKLLS